MFYKAKTSYIYKMSGVLTTHRLPWHDIHAWIAGQLCSGNGGASDADPLAGEEGRAGDVGEPHGLWHRGACRAPRVLVLVLSGRRGVPCPWSARSPPSREDWRRRHDQKKHARLLV
jgi:hypothetical protein